MKFMGVPESENVLREQSFCVRMRLGVNSGKYIIFFNRANPHARW